MSLLPKLSRKRAPAKELEEERVCGHWELAPRWATNEDIGKKEKVTTYICSGCGQAFTPGEAEGLRRSA